MAAAPPPFTALWLLPAPDDARRLGEAILGLARRLGAPVFAPHVTLFGGVEAPLERVEASLRRAAAATAPFTTGTSGLGHSPAFFQCVFVELAESPEVRALRQLLGSELGRDPGDAPRPHLSLIYQRLDAATRRALCLEHAGLATPFRFDALALVAPAPGARDWLDVEGWRTLGRFPLRGEG